MSIHEGGEQQYEIRITVHADGEGFAQNVILNLHAGDAPLPAGTFVIDYLRAGARQEAMFLCRAEALPLVGLGPVPHVSLVEVRGQFFNAAGQQVRFNQAGRIDLDEDRIRFTSPPVYEENEDQAVLVE